MDPTLWGEHAWYLMHRVTIYYPNNPTPQHKQNIKKFFNTIQKVLPCDACKKGFKKNLEIYQLRPIHLSSRENLVKWLFTIHNRTNQKTGERRISYAAFKKTINDELNKPILSKYIQLLKSNMWSFIHYVIQAYPNIVNSHDRIEIKEFLTHLPKVLPPGKMREDYERKLGNNPLNINSLKSQKAMSLWYNKMNKL